MRSKVEVILSALLKGYPVMFDGDEYYLGDNNELVRKVEVRGTKSDGSNGLSVKDNDEFLGYKYLTVEHTLGQFIKACYNIPDKDITIIAGNMTLNDINRETRTQKRR